MICIHINIVKPIVARPVARANPARRHAKMDRIEMAGHLIRRLHQQSTQVFQARSQAAGFDLTSVQFAALDAIAQQPGIDQAGLAATISFDRPTIGGVIDRLEHKGLVRRVVGAHDRRARQLHLTPAGRKLLAAARPVVEALQADILAALSPAERAAFVTLAHKALGLRG
jgi:DNA-binding MarR family transcriptional regulator